MLFWGLAGFVDPDGHVDKKEGLGADALAEFAGVDEHDEFFKDNAIEVIQDHQCSQIVMKISIKLFQSGGTTMFWLLMGFFYLVNNLT